MNNFMKQKDILKYLNTQVIYIPLNNNYYYKF